MGNKIIVPFSDKKGGVYELNVDLDKLSKGERMFKKVCQTEFLVQLNF